MSIYILSHLSICFYLNNCRMDLFTSLEESKVGGGESINVKFELSCRVEFKTSISYTSTIITIVSGISLSKLQIRKQSFNFSSLVYSPPSSLPCVKSLNYVHYHDDSYCSAKLLKENAQIPDY